VLAIIGGALFARFLVRSPGAGLLWSRWEAPAAHFVSTHASPGDPSKMLIATIPKETTTPTRSKLAEPNCECPVSTKKPPTEIGRSASAGRATDHERCYSITGLGARNIDDVELTKI
jgi:hypothetical protein